MIKINATPSQYQQQSNIRRRNKTENENDKQKVGCFTKGESRKKLSTSTQSCVDYAL